MKLKREIRWYEKEIKWKEACDVTEFDEVEDGTQCMMSKGMWITLYGMVWYGMDGMVWFSAAMGRNPSRRWKKLNLDDKWFMYDIEHFSYLTLDRFGISEGVWMWTDRVWVKLKELFSYSDCW